MIVSTVHLVGGGLHQGRVTRVERERRRRRGSERRRVKWVRDGSRGLKSDARVPKMPSASWHPAPGFAWDVVRHDLAMPLARNCCRRFHRRRWRKSASRPGRSKIRRASSSTRVSPRHGTSAIAFLDPLPRAERGSVGVLPAFLGAWAKSAFPANVENLVTWEKQTAATSFAVLLVKFLRCDTLDGWIADVFAYGKSSSPSSRTSPTPRAASSRGTSSVPRPLGLRPSPVASACERPHRGDPNDPRRLRRGSAKVRVEQRRS